MGRPFGSRNRVYRVAQRDRRRIAAVAQGVTIGRAFGDGFSPDHQGRIAGYSPAHARRLLVRSMEKLGAMADGERERLKRLPPPAPEGTVRRRALALRMAGTPYPDIAAELGIREDTAIGYVREQVERLRGEEVRRVDVARELELARLDAMQARVWPRAVEGDTRAALTVLKIMDRRAKLLGLDAPVKVDVEHRIPDLTAQYGVDPDELRVELAIVVEALPASKGAS